MAGWDRGAPTPIVQNSHQAKQEPDKGPPWICPGCFHMGNMSTSTHCIKCGMLRPEERMMRMQARVVQGMGRGGGYFERNDPSDRRQASDDEKEVDMFGRRRSLAKSSSSGAGASADGEVVAAAPEDEESSAGKPGTKPRNSLVAGVSAPPTKAERQKAALERLRNPKKNKTELSPPRNRTFRDKSSRSRSRDAKKKGGGFIFSGGLM
mmetsp:Transcript_2427/g.9479  ORF Transcript_2427/g.9479 Transcript_2427/m.9479 type:complete len:208 (+) Transcript_2427:100-723(+)